MTADTKHLLGHLLMWSGVALCAAGAAVILDGTPLGAILLLAGTLAALAGALIKKIHCPRCRDEACKLPSDSEER